MTGANPLPVLRKLLDDAALVLVEDFDDPGFFWVVDTLGQTVAGARWDIAFQYVVRFHRGNRSSYVAGQHRVDVRGLGGRYQLVVVLDGSPSVPVEVDFSTFEEAEYHAVSVLMTMSPGLPIT